MSDSRTRPEHAGTPDEDLTAPTTTGGTHRTAQPASSEAGVHERTDPADHTRPIPATERERPAGAAVAPAAAVAQRDAATRSADRPRAGREEDALVQHERAEEVRREQFGGYNAGAGFFGWLVAIALSVLLASIVGAVVTAISANLQVDQTEAERRAGSIGLGTAIALLVILMVGYYAGGYVAGRMSRFDGGRQGVGVWLIGLVVTLVAVGLGVLFGAQYNILDRVDLPSIPIPRDTLTGGGIVSAIAILIGTLLAAVAGGKVGQRYHRKVDHTGL